MYNFIPLYNNKESFQLFLALRKLLYNCALLSTVFHNWLNIYKKHNEHENSYIFCAYFCKSVHATIKVNK